MNTHLGHWTNGHKFLDLTTWQDDTGQILRRVHSAKACKGRGCPIHHPSNHSMVAWPLHWCFDRRLMERLCPHGIGHPDPDHMAFDALTHGKRHAEIESIHRCDGCCYQRTPEQEP